MTQVVAPPIDARNASHPRDLRRAAVALVVALAVGTALRVAAALGPLGLDEVWSLRLAGTLPSIGDAFWGLPHDNNHALNTAAMVALGPGRPAWAYRVPALVLGAATIPAVGYGLARLGAVTAAVGAALAAVALPFVDFGSEARGYAGLVLASVLAIGAWRRAVTAPGRDTRHARWGLAAAAGLGALCHLAMIMTVAVLVAATLLLGVARSRRIGPTLAATARLFAPAAAALLPAAGALAIALRRGGGFRIGDVDPFTPAKLATGLSEMVALTLGVPTSPLAPLFAALVLACLAAAARRRLLDPPMAALCAAAFGALPAGLWMAGVPNVGYARYFAICAVVLVLALAEITGRLWARGRMVRPLAAAGLGAVLAAGLMGDLKAIRDGRSPGPATLRIMVASRDATFATSHPRMTGLLLDATGPPEMAAPGDAQPCPAPPGWYVAVGVFDARPSGTLAYGSDACRHTYRAYAPFASNPISGTQWTLYRRADGGSSGVTTVAPGSGT